MAKDKKKLFNVGMGNKKLLSKKKILGIFTLNAKHQSFKLWFFFRLGDSSPKARADGY